MRTQPSGEREALESISAPRPPSVEEGRPKFRADIQGLRAVAVGLVVINHLIGWPNGGFVGVDVFFVISGYLISGILVRELCKTGWISLPRFYARRLRRIVPVATVVGLTTVVTAYIFWLAPRANQTSLDALASLLWVSNWHFAGIGTDYLTATGPTSPLLHFWSLSIEEQFYLGWPWLLILFASLGSFAPIESKRIAMLSGISFFAIASFALSMFLTQRAPSIAYFETLSRSWELAAGAVLAVLASRLERMPDWVARFLTPLGITLIFASATFLAPESAFPGPWALVPVMGAALVIAGGSKGIHSRFLSMGIAQYVGKISYSLYLWHFPVIVITHSLLPGIPMWAVLIEIVVMFILAALSYKYIEVPTRHSRWLHSWDRSSRSRTPSRKKEALIAAVVAALVICMAGLQLKGPDFLRDGSALTSSEQTALDKCRNKAGAELPQICQYGPPTGSKSVLVIGDSVAASWVPTVAAAFPEWKVSGLGFANCSPFEVDTLPRRDNGDFVQNCRESKQLMRDEVHRSHPNLVVLSSDLGGFERFADGSSGTTASEKWAAAVQKAVTEIGAGGSHVVVMGSPPTGGDIRDCPTRLTGYTNCDTKISTNWKEKTAAEKAGALRGGATYVNVGDWFCDPEARCPAVIDGHVVRVDPTHTSDTFAETLGDKLAAELKNLQSRG